MSSAVLKAKAAKAANLIVKLFTIILISLAVASLLTPVWTKSNAIIHTVLEIFCIVIAISSFFVVWFVSNIRPTKLALGLGFLAVAIFDIFHTYFWHGLGLSPAFYYDLPTRYWVVGRFLEALFLIISTTSIGQLSAHRHLGLFLTVLFSFSVGAVIYYYPNLFPVLLTTQGVTPAKILMEYITIAMFSGFLYRVYKGHFQEDKVTKEYLVLAGLIAIPAELCFTLYTTFTNYSNVLGHVFKITYYYFFLRAVFAGYVAFPYRMLQHSEERLAKTNEELQESEDRYRTLYENSMDGILIAKTNGTIISVNPAFCQMVGLSEAEICRAGRHGLVDGSDPRLNELLNVTEKLGSCKGEFHLLHREDYKVPVEGTFQIYYSSMGEELISIIVRDLTERQRNQQEIAQLDRLNLIGQVAASIAHEVRNPLTTIRGFLQILVMKGNLKQEYINLMLEEIDRASGIISEFLSLAKNKPLCLKICNLNSVVKSFLPVLEAEGMERGKIIVTELEHIPEIELDENEIRQLILNLVKNGLEAMESGKKLTIRTFEDANQVILAIKDEGPGISQHIIDKIGTPFVTTKEKGTGLGLQVSYKIAARHGAIIDFTTGPNGTTFFVRFNVYNDQSLTQSRLSEIA